MLTYNIFYVIVCSYTTSEVDMNTFSIRLETDLLKIIDRFAKQNDRSRNYVIAKILKEKFNYKLIGDSD